MNARPLIKLLAAWALLTAVGCIAVYRWCHIDERDPPSREAALAALTFAGSCVQGGEWPNYTAAAPIIVTRWRGGDVEAQFVGETDLKATLNAACEAGFAGRSAGRYTIDLPTGEGPVFTRWPLLNVMTLVPMREMLTLEVNGESARMTPGELLARDGFAGAIPTPLPDLRFGMNVPMLAEELGRRLGLDPDEVWDQGRLRRDRVHTITSDEVPSRREVSAASLKEAAVAGARFLIRHQEQSGRYTYVYDGVTGEAQNAGYNLPRHAGTTYFLAQVARIADVPEARAAALKALRWARGRMRRCGEHGCFAKGGIAEMGSSALLATAAAEVLAGGHDPVAATMLEELTGFIRAQQREDGELMHLYRIREQEPEDVQLLYYSGEAALALLMAHEVTDDPRNLEAARKLMKHLTGAGWDFFGSRYYYGEEHWTCIAAGRAGDRIESAGALEFCQRWAEFNRAIQFGPDYSPWNIDGAYGVGPVVLPRLTPVASRSEAFISTYEMAAAAGADTEVLEDQIERGLGMLMRWQWLPGPTYALADPEGAYGGLPASPGDLTVRNDFVQHACSAMIRWAEILEKREAGSAGFARAQEVL